MMNTEKSGKLFFVFLFVIILLFFNACHGDFVIPGLEDDNENSITTNAYIIIKGNTDIIKDCTPEFSIFTEKTNIASMSFSGNGKDWSEWVAYSENYDQFNIANGLYGTDMESGVKTIYVRFKDINDVIYPQDFQEPVCCKFEYEIQQLFSIEIEPNEIEIKTGESQKFIVKGYDLFSKNEIPLDGKKIEWSKSCGVGKLNPIISLQTTYTAPDIPGPRNISAHYGSLGTGAKIYIIQE
ncbi:MAG: hypothetical protein PHQ99_05425 [Atribacterota bacterium]|nr:hypothetical protein [Atribacterota bacterium]